MYARATQTAGHPPAVPALSGITACTGTSAVAPGSPSPIPTPEVSSPPANPGAPPPRPVLARRRLQPLSCRPRAVSATGASPAAPLANIVCEASAPPRRLPHGPPTRRRATSHDAHRIAAARGAAPQCHAGRDNSQCPLTQLQCACVLIGPVSTPRRAPREEGDRIVLDDRYGQDAAGASSAVSPPPAAGRQKRFAEAMDGCANR